jgi:hypothetical protein
MGNWYSRAIIRGDDTHSPVMVKVSLLRLCDIVSLLFRYSTVGSGTKGGGPGIQWVFLSISHVK